ncbi:MAG TPA: L-2-amino-thiazoline-4-carboxylic acid hydrolase [Thermodesulfobacteriota bacterium]|nr:L-2-amino-thiazoline-4-carboxylic acid hydrolase [Thermodesulfobacteriota bacterium]
MSEQARARVSIDDAIVTNLLRTVRSQITDLRGRSWQEFEASVRARATMLVEQNESRAIDGPSRQWLLLSCIILAAYQELQPLVDDAQAVLSILGYAITVPFTEHLTAYIADRFGISRDAPEEAFTRIAENFKARGEERFGKAYTYIQEVQDEGRSFVNIQKCFFNDFFRANGMPELTLIFCAMDNLWAEELEKPCYGVRFERPTTLAQGGDLCRFQFSKRSAKQ